MQHNTAGITLSNFIGNAGGITVIDDYAHNPAKITAAWQAVKPFHKRVIAVWRPHGFGPLAMLADDLVSAFFSLLQPMDLLCLLPVYYAGGTAKRGLVRKDLAKFQILQRNVIFLFQTFVRSLASDYEIPEPSQLAELLEDDI